MHLIYKILLSSLIVSFSFGFYAKIEPINSYNIKSDISGKVVDVNRSAIATNYKGVTIKVDSYDDEVNLKKYEKQLKILKDILKFQKDIAKRKTETFINYKKLKSKSKLEKKGRFYDYATAFIAVGNTQTTILDLEAKIDILKDRIDKKKISLKNYIYEIAVHKGNYLTPGKLIAKTVDLSLKKLYIYVPINKIESIKDKKIYINGELSNFKIDYVEEVADEKFVTSYKVKLVGTYPTCSEVVKVEFK